ncbi:MAG: DUF721 domain-containing protein [Sandaracinaceae bacterium]
MKWRPRRRRIKRPKSVPTRLSAVLDGAYPGRRADRPLLRTFSWWDRVVPPRIAKRARPVSLKHGTLIVHCGSSSWAQELSFHERDLLASVQRSVPEIRRLRIRVGPMPAPPAPPEPPPPKTEPIPMHELPDELARGLARLSDDGLRDAVGLAARTQLASMRKPPKR